MASNDLINTFGGPYGFGTNYLVGNDDGSTGAIDITAAFPNGIDLYGTYYTSIYVNNNGNVTFASPLDTYTPEAIGTGYTSPIIAPYWADVDTRGGTTTPTGGNSAGTNLAWYDVDAATHTVAVTWDDVGYYADHTNLEDSFQLIMTAEPDSNGQYSGQAQIEFIYQTIQWTTGDASGGSGGLGGFPAQEGYSAGDGVNYYDLPGSGTEDAAVALPETVGNTGTVGVWVFNTTNTGTIQPVTCFTKGTAILTSAGFVAVETLAVGDLVTTRAGDWRPITWIGQRRVNCLAHPDPSAVWPVRIRAGALASGSPRADLLLSPDHALYHDGALIPVKYLIDGEVIAQVKAPTVEYFHIELESHDVINAQGVAVETYLDTGDRAAFDNGGPAVTLHPSFAVRARDAASFAPIEITGPRVEALRAKLRRDPGPSKVAVARQTSP